MDSVVSTRYQWPSTMLTATEPSKRAEPIAPNEQSSHPADSFAATLEPEGNQCDGSRHQDREGRIAILATQPPVTEHGCHGEQTISEGRMTMAELPR